MDDARVICRQLDLGEPVAVTKKAHFGQGLGIQIMILELQKNNNQKSAILVKCLWTEKNRFVTAFTKDCTKDLRL